MPSTPTEDKHAEQGAARRRGQADQMILDSNFSKLERRRADGELELRQIKKNRQNLDALIAAKEKELGKIAEEVRFVEEERRNLKKKMNAV